MAAQLDVTAPEELPVTVPAPPPPDVGATVGALARSAGWSAIAHVAVAASAFAVSVLLGRVLTPETFGRSSYYLWILRTLPVILALGVPSALGKFLAEKIGAGAGGEARGLARLAIRGHATAAAVTTAFAAGAVALGLASPLFLVIVAGVGVAVLLIDFEAMLTGLLRFRLLGALAVVVAVLQVAGVALGAAAGLEWEGFVVLLVGLATLNMAVLAVAAGRALPRELAVAPAAAERSRFLRFAGLAAFTIVLDSVLWGRPELLFLDRYGTDVDLGNYSVALRIASLGAVLPLVASRPLLPAFSQLRGAQASRHLAEVFPRVSAILALVGAPLALIGAVVAAPVIEVVYGGDYSGAATATQILFVGSLVGALTGPATAAMLTGPRPRFIAELGVAAVVANLALDVAVIPHFGVTGAAVVNVAVQAAWVTAGMAYADRIGLRYPADVLARAVGFAAMGAATTAALLGPSPDFVRTFGAGTLGILVYVACVATSRVTAAVVGRGTTAEPSAIASARKERA